ncbi:MAG: GntR family transcriptional regulator [Desulfuromonas sp.]|nr:MAG: GntR family transcriptional regulator [Desulfuromonas sp.]
MLKHECQQVASQTLYETVAGRIAYLVEEGTLRPGERVPSIRSLSKQLGVSINTVKEAYSHLEDRRLIEARPQSGYYVRARLPDLPDEPVVDEPALRPTEVSLGKVYRMVMKDQLNPGLVPFGLAIPDPELLPIDKLNRMLSSASRRARTQAVSYALPPGSEKLRTQIARRALSCGCTFSPDEVLITSGCVEAVVLALRVLSRPGDTILVETPIYFNFLQQIEDLGLKTLEIPASSRDGISLDALGYALEHTQDRIAACLVISNFNNPLGGQVPDENKRRLVELLEQYQVPLIEDDIYGDLSFADKRPVVAKAYDRSGNVLLCSSFSKTLAPGYRVGWIAAGRYQEQIERAKMLANVATATPTQLAIAEFLSTGGYDHHLRTIRRVYARQVAQMADAIGRYFPVDTRVTRPLGGFILWVEMPQQISAMKLYEQARQVGITFAPGPLFSASGKYQNCIRLNAAFWRDEIDGAVATLGRLAQEQLR